MFLVCSDSRSYMPDMRGTKASRTPAGKLLYEQIYSILELQKTNYIQQPR